MLGKDFLNQKPIEDPELCEVLRDAAEYSIQEWATEAKALTKLNPCPACNGKMFIAPYDNGTFAAWCLKPGCTPMGKICGTATLAAEAWAEETEN